MTRRPVIKYFLIKPLIFFTFVILLILCRGCKLFFRRRRSNADEGREKPPETGRPFGGGTPDRSPGIIRRAVYGDERTRAVHVEDAAFRIHAFRRNGDPVVGAREGVLG